MRAKGRHFWRTRAGFTLLEIMIVLGITGILASVTIVAINPGKQLCAANDAKRKSSERTIERAVLQYLIDNANLPSGITSEPRQICRRGASGDCLSLDTLIPTYVADIPVDPKATDDRYSDYKIYKDDAERVQVISTYDDQCAQEAAASSSEAASSEAASSEQSSAASSESSSELACGGGGGTSEDPYMICDCAHLQTMNTIAYSALANDIDCSATSGWNAGAGFDPIGPLTGTLDGAGYTVSGLTINRPLTSNVGLFTTVYVGGTVKNLHMTGINYIAAGRTGGIAGYIMQGAVTNVSVTGTITTNSAEGYTGGIAGIHNTAAGSISKSWADVDINATASIIGNGGAGGLVGTLNNNAPITNSYALGDVTAVGLPAGGIAGYSEGGASITNSYAVGHVSTDSASHSGITPGTNGGSGCYYNSATTGQSDTFTGTPKTTIQMRQQATYVGWDFTTVWQIAPGQYPTLR